MIEGPLLDIRKHYMNGTYAFTTKDQQPFAALDVQERDHTHTGHRAIIKAENYPSKVVQDLAASGQLIGFEEVLPSVADIFIDIVENGPKPKNS